MTRSAQYDQGPVGSAQPLTNGQGVEGTFKEKKTCPNITYENMLFHVVNQFGSPGSGSVLGMRIRIQEQGNCPKFTNESDFQPSKRPLYLRR